MMDKIITIILIIVIFSILSFTTSHLVTNKKIENCQSMPVIDNSMKGDCVRRLQQNKGTDNGK